MLGGFQAFFILINCMGVQFFKHYNSQCRKLQSIQMPAHQTSEIENLAKPVQIEVDKSTIMYDRRVTITFLCLARSYL